ncbi:glycerate kinase type-2 family protein [Harryflintia acetispora]|uniref:Hydroxypyruvate reductase n=1 Tax=Harryflintia acetispora TaxID=1849041 RepID=A0A9X8UIP3_9FIRM|nr:glycerate kinase [Harryflintia acetispora]TCL42392.1 hydroxypyruvate reductase [Harryflintia acetispora]
MTLREDANRIVSDAITAALPDTAVKKALEGRSFGPGRLVLVALGKAGWQMARSAYDLLGERIEAGVVVTKYQHAKGPIGNFKIVEAGHPVPDENSFSGTRAAIDLVRDLGEDDTVLFLVSGGGSALFEQPLISPEELQGLTGQLLACGADIVEMNTIRKRFSAVKGGRFAQICAPAKVFSIVLSDIIGDPLDMIASGPAYPDSSTSDQAREIARKYNLTLTPKMEELLLQETPKELHNVETHITGSVRQLCRAAAKCCEELGYEPHILTASLCCEAREAGSFLSSIAQYHQDCDHSLAFIAGGETVVHLTGKGLGGRNQELALAGAAGIAGLPATALFSVGSDGTDGPTDAAGGYVDNTTFETLKEAGTDVFEVLRQNDSYHALERCGGLIRTGATGTNVNDVAVLLLRR